MDQTNSVNELDLLVGSIFTARPEEDRELFEEEREWLSDVQDLLREEGVEVDLLSKPGVEVWEGGIERFTDLYQLRLIAAYLEQGQDIAPLLERDAEVEGELDEQLAAIWEGEQITRFPHLINHQADGGYYLPVDFPEPVWLEVDQEELEVQEEGEIEEQVVSFGSSVALQRELVELAQMLNQAHVPEDHPVYRCLNVLREAADQSVANDLPIIIW
jgi:hypothetical protein